MGPHLLPASACRAARPLLQQPNRSRSRASSRPASHRLRRWTVTLSRWPGLPTLLTRVRLASTRWRCWTIGRRGTCCRRRLSRAGGPQRDPGGACARGPGCTQCAILPAQARRGTTPTRSSRLTATAHRHSKPSARGPLAFPKSCGLSGALARTTARFFSSRPTYWCHARGAPSSGNCCAPSRRQQQRSRCCCRGAILMIWANGSTALRRAAMSAPTSPGRATSHTLRLQTGCCERRTRCCARARCWRTMRCSYPSCACTAFTA
mmetsp:Transcript_41725/g.97939  ORF Transcript_41725/g.97939 Transcript_41725/m.97939 type:complete len:264 (-) Transcript_41725:529-1320(-)